MKSKDINKDIKEGWNGLNFDKSRLFDKFPERDYKSISKKRKNKSGKNDK